MYLVIQGGDRCLHCGGGGDNGQIPNLFGKQDGQALRVV